MNKIKNKIKVVVYLKAAFSIFLNKQKFANLHVQTSDLLFFSASDADHVKTP